jgi:hypothetical protein
MFLAYFPKVGLCNLHPVCVHVNPPYQFLSAWTNIYETCYVYNGNWVPLNGVLHKSLPSVCVSACVSTLSLLTTARLSVSLHSVLGNSSVNTIPRQWIHDATEEFFDASFSMRSVPYQTRGLSVCLWRVVGGDEKGSLRSVSYQRKLGYQFFQELPVVLYYNTEDRTSLTLSPISTANITLTR